MLFRSPRYALGTLGSADPSTGPSTGNNDGDGANIDTDKFIAGDDSL